MKRIIFTLIACFSTLCIHAQYSGTDPLGTVSYALPQTVIRFEVEASIEDFHAGPYARYAGKYLGIQVRERDEKKARISAIKMNVRTEADQNKRYVITPGAGSMTFLKLTGQGLISTGGDVADDTQWNFAEGKNGDFSSKGLSSNLTSESATLYRRSDNDEAYKIAVRQEMVVEKSLDDKAKEAAGMIFNLRKKRVQIVTGDTDASYGGEAMASAIAEIDRLEKEYLTLFTGYSDFETQKMNYDVIPTVDNTKQMYVAFRLSDSKGLVGAEDVSGKPYLMELIPQSIAAAENKTKPARGTNIAYYRIPAICGLRLSDGTDILLQSRVPVYQLGVESNFVLSSK